MFERIAKDILQTMKYSLLSSFFKHLKNAKPNHFCPIYLIFCDDPFERKKVLQKSASLICDQARFFEDISSDTFAHEILSPSLFSEKEVIAVDYSYSLDKKEVEKMGSLLKKQGDLVILIASPSINHWQPILPFVEEEGVILELLGKKSKEERMRIFLQAKAKQWNKILPPQVLFLLIERAGSDFAKLVHEVDKLFLFVGEKKELSLNDLKIVSTPEHTIWHIVEKMVWKREKVDLVQIDENMIFPLISILRNELRLGNKLCQLSKYPKTISSIKLWPSLLEKRKKQAKQLTENYFIKGLISLFETELLLKDGAIHYDLLLLRWMANLYETHTPSQSTIA